MLKIRRKYNIRIIKIPISVITVNVTLGNVLRLLSTKNRISKTNFWRHSFVRIQFSQIF